MKIQVPQRSGCAVTSLEITGPDLFKVIQVSSEIAEIERDFGVDERLIRITAQALNNAREPVGPETVLKEAEVVEPDIPGQVPEQEPEQDEEVSEEDVVEDVEDVDDLGSDAEREEDITEPEAVEEVTPPWKRNR